MLELEEFLYCLAISLQLSGALLVVYNSYSNLKRDNLIKNFLKNSFTIKIPKNSKSKKDLLNYNHEAFLDFICLQYKNFISVIYIFMGYILGIFGKINNEILEIMIIIIIILTLVILFATNKAVKYKNKNIKKIELKELEELNISPTIETASDEEIESLFEDSL